jgi:hypothetical protein
MSLAMSLLGMLLLCGCSSDGAATEPDAAVAPDAPRSLAAINVTVGYTGTQQGALVVAAFHSGPSMDDPAAFQTVPMPTFPAHVVLRDLEPGTFRVTTVLDMAPASPTMPGAEDIQAASGPVMLAGSDSAVSLILVDH